MLSLIPFSPAHFEDLLTWFPTEADLIQWAGPTLKFPLDRTQLEEIVAETHPDPPQRLAWTAISHSGLMVGHIQLVIDRLNGVGRLARVAIAPSQRQQGYGAHMVRHALIHAFEDANVERIELNVFSFNRAAIHTYEKLGFILEGTRRSSARVGAERWDMMMMGLLRSEFQNLC
jgi:RimJ/RimL family protein N-acetyltransferase